MKIRSIHIEGFRSIRDLDINFPTDGILTLVGANNAGKSNVLRAINNILGEHWVRGETLDINDYYKRDLDTPVKIVIEFTDGKRVEFDSTKKWAEYLGADGRKIYASNGGVKDDFPCTYLAADRSLEKNLQFKKWELMGKIAKSFNQKAQPVKESLEEKFDEVMDILDTVDSFQQFKTDFVGFFEEMQADTPYRLKVDFRAFSPLNYFKSIHILANDASLSTAYDIDVEEMGDGNKNLLLFALARSYAKNFRQEACGILAIEEPEIYLHPQGRRHLYSILKEIASESNFQVIFSTHSSSFVHTEEFYHIGVVSKHPEEGTQVAMLTRQELVDFCKATGVPEAKVNMTSIVEHYAATSHYSFNEGFFARMIVLVEGATEELVLPIYLKKAGIDCDRLGISVVQVIGKGNIPKYWRLFYSFGFPMVVVFDNDSGSHEEASNRVLAECFSIDTTDVTDGVTVFKNIDAENEGVFSQKLLILEHDFETAVQKDFMGYTTENGITPSPTYHELESLAKDAVKPTGAKAQKAQVARYVAIKLIEHFPDYCPSFITELAESIRGVIPATRPAPDGPTPAESIPEAAPATSEASYRSEIRPEDLPF